MLIGDLAGAIQFHRRALMANPGSVSAQRTLAYLLKRAGQMSEALQLYRELLEAHPDDVDAKIDFGIALAAAGAAGPAIACLRQGVMRKPQDLVARAALGQLFRDHVPVWHFAMLNDAGRNAAYDQAIRRAVTPGSIVLDIGTGSGLLAMMAARAGAAHVYACEAQPLIAEKAREIVHANGLAEQITIIPKSSIQLRINHDLPRKVDILVSEIVDASLIGEGMVLTLAHAFEHLVAELAAIIPRAGRVLARLIESEALYHQDRVAQAGGFDVSAFNEFSRYGSRTLDLRQYPYRTLSQPTEVFGFDFTKSNFRPETKALAFEATAGGICHGLATWFELTLDDAVSISSDPMTDAVELHWLQTVYLWDPPRIVQAQEKAIVAVSHDMLHVHFLAE